MYEERPSSLVPAVVWRTTGPAESRVVPDGCMDLIWFGDRLLVAGPDTASFRTEAPAGVELVGLRFAPGVGPHVFALPAVELRDSRVPLDEVWDASLVRRLHEGVHASTDRAASLEALARGRLAQGSPIPADLTALVTLVDRGVRVSSVADRLGLSERQLHRRSLAAFGYGPKVLGRILRFRRASQLLRSGVNQADAAVISGYADQPHMTREFRRLSGEPAGAAVALRADR